MIFAENINLILNNNYNNDLKISKKINNKNKNILEILKNNLKNFNINLNNFNFIYLKNNFQKNFNIFKKRWFFSTNAKDIATLYLIFSIFTGLLGTAFSILIRLELSAPGNQFLGGNHQLYNVVATTHGIMIIYFMVVPSIAGFANYFAPLMVGAPDNILLIFFINKLFLIF